MSSDRPSSRPDLYVVARIVSDLREKGHVKRTQLATMTGLSYDSLAGTLTGWARRAS